MGFMKVKKGSSSNNYKKQIGSIKNQIGNLKARLKRDVLSDVKKQATLSDIKRFELQLLALEKDYMHKESRKKLKKGRSKGSKGLVNRKKQEILFLQNQIKYEQLSESEKSILKSKIEQLELKIKTFQEGMRLLALRELEEKQLQKSFQKRVYTKFVQGGLTGLKKWGQ